MHMTIYMFTVYLKLYIVSSRRNTNKGSTLSVMLRKYIVTCWDLQAYQHVLSCC